MPSLDYSTKKLPENTPYLQKKQEPTPDQPANATWLIQNLLNPLLDALKQDIEALENAELSNESNITTTQSQLSTAQGDISTLQSDLGSLQTALADITTRLQTEETISSDLQTQINNAQNLISTAQGSINTLQNNLSLAQGDISTLQSDLSTAQGDISTLQSDLSTAQGDISTLQNDRNDINQKYGLSEAITKIQLKALLQKVYPPQVYVGFVDGYLDAYPAQANKPEFYNWGLQPLGSDVADLEPGGDRSLYIVGGNEYQVMNVLGSYLQFATYNDTVEFTAVDVDKTTDDNYQWTVLGVNNSPSIDIRDQFNNFDSQVSGKDTGWDNSNPEFYSYPKDLSFNNGNDEIIMIDAGTTESRIYRWNFNNIEELLESTFYSGVIFSCVEHYENDFFNFNDDDAIFAGTTTGELKKIEERNLVNNIWTNSEHTDQINAIAFDTEGNIYTASADGSVKKHDQTGTTLWTYSDFPNPVIGVGVDQRDGKIFACDSQGLLKHLDNTPAEVWQFDIAYGTTVLKVG
jgi:hypothetical protein